MVDGILPLNATTVDLIVNSAIKRNRVHILAQFEQNGVFPIPIVQNRVIVAMQMWRTGCMGVATQLLIDVRIEIRRNNLAFMRRIHGHNEIRTIGIEEEISIAHETDSVETAGRGPTPAARDKGPEHRQLRWLPPHARSLRRHQVLMRPSGALAAQPRRATRLSKAYEALDEHRESVVRMMHERRAPGSSRYELFHGSDMFCATEHEGIS